MARRFSNLNEGTTSSNFSTGVGKRVGKKRTSLGGGNATTSASTNLSTESKPVFGGRTGMRDSATQNRANANNLQNQNAKMTREMFEFVSGTFDPLEHQMRTYANNDKNFRDAEQDAMKATQMQFRNQQGIRDRNLRSRNIQLSNDQRFALDRNLQRESTLTGINNANKARTATANRKRAIQNNLLDHGMQTVNKALNQGSQLSQMEASRNARNDAAKSQFQSNLLSTGLSAGMLFL